MKYSMNSFGWTSVCVWLLSASVSLKAETKVVDTTGSMTSSGSEAYGETVIEYSTSLRHWGPPTVDFKTDKEVKIIYNHETAMYTTETNTHQHGQNWVYDEFQNTGVDYVETRNSSTRSTESIHHFLASTQLFVGGGEAGESGTYTITKVSGSPFSFILLDSKFASSSDGASDSTADPVEYSVQVVEWDGQTLTPDILGVEKSPLYQSNGGMTTLVNIGIEERDNWWALDNSNDPNDLISSPWMSVGESVSGGLVLSSRAQFVGPTTRFPAYALKLVPLASGSVADLIYPESRYLSSDVEEFAVKGLAVGESSLSVELSGEVICDDFVKIEVLPQAYLRVKIHILEDPDHLSQPANISESSLNEILSLTWFNQANIVIDSDVERRSVDYDVMDDIMANGDGDGSLDLDTSSGTFSIEENILRNEIDPDYQINVFVVASIDDVRNSSSRHTHGVNRYNVSHALGGFIIVESNDEILDTIAHEFGHSFGIQGKLAPSDDDQGHSSQGIDLLASPAARASLASGVEPMNIRKHQWSRANSFVSNNAN